MRFSRRYFGLPEPSDARERRQARPRPRGFHLGKEILRRLSSQRWSVASLFSSLDNCDTVHHVFQSPATQTYARPRSGCGQISQLMQYKIVVFSLC